MAFDLASLQASGHTTTVSGEVMRLISVVPDAIPGQRLVMLDEGTQHIETYGIDGSYFSDGAQSVMDLT